MISIAVTGACGRMAGQVIRAAVEAGDIEVAVAVDAPNSPQIGKDIGDFLGIGTLGVDVVAPESLDEQLKQKKPKILVDFTTPNASVKNAKIAAENGVYVLVGTTGLSDSQKEEIRKSILSNNVAGMIVSNFSLCVNLFFKLAEQAASALKGYDVEIIEAHHRFKKDAPSGTAMSLAKIIADAKELDLNKKAVYGREGLVGARGDGEIGIHAIRAGDIAGEHTVLFGTLGERLEIKYQAHSRDAFARGCVATIPWLAQMGSGIYDMWDMMGLK